MARTLGTLSVISILLVGTAATANAAGPAAPAAAAATSASGSGQIVATMSAPSGQMTAAAVIVCTPNVQNPHNSTHVPGTVNVVVTLSCTAPVRSINIRAALYRNGLLVRDSGQRTVNNSSFAQHNAAVPCQNATYQGWMSYGVLFPPGFVPPTGSGSGFGNVVSITCR